MKNQRGRSISDVIQAGVWRRPSHDCQCNLERGRMETQPLRDILRRISRISWLANLLRLRIADILQLHRALHATARLQPPPPAWQSQHASISWSLDLARTGCRTHARVRKKRERIMYVHARRPLGRPESDRGLSTCK